MRLYQLPNTYIEISIPKSKWNYLNRLESSKKNFKLPQRTENLKTFKKYLNYSTELNLDYQKVLRLPKTTQITKKYLIKLPQKVYLKAFKSTKNVFKLPKST